VAGDYIEQAVYQESGGSLNIAEAMMTCQWISAAQSGSVLPGSVIGHTAYDPASQTDVDTSSTSLVDIDATNIKVDFVVPASGAVLIDVQTLGRNNNVTGWHLMALREGSTTIDELGFMYYAVATANGVVPRTTATFKVSGLTPGASKTYKVAQRVEGGTVSRGVTYGGTAGPFIIKVTAL